LLERYHQLQHHAEAEQKAQQVFQIVAHDLQRQTN
jgi:hypothetical protein